MEKYTYSILVLGLAAGLANGQALTEFGAAAAGGAVGAASGKAVSNGIDAVFGKLNDQTVQAAGKGETKPKPDVKPVEKPAAPPSAPLISGGGSNVGSAPGGGGSSLGSGRGTAPRRVAKNIAPQDDTVPPPPPLAREARPADPVLPTLALQRAPFAPLTLADALPANPIAPPPTMTPESFKQVAVGMTRADVLKLGDPASRIQMFEDGHMTETFSYRAGGERFGRLRLQDGAVAKIETN